jgi:hypothetical protein
MEEGASLDKRNQIQRTGACLESRNPGTEDRESRYGRQGSAWIPEGIQLLRTGPAWIPEIHIKQIEASLHIFQESRNRGQGQPGLQKSRYRRQVPSLDSRNPGADVRFLYLLQESRYRKQYPAWISVRIQVLRTGARLDSSIPSIEDKGKPIFRESRTRGQVPNYTLVSML